MRQESFMLGHEFNWLSWSGLRHYPDDVLTKFFHIFIEFHHQDQLACFFQASIILLLMWTLICIFWYLT